MGRQNKQVAENTPEIDAGADIAAIAELLDEVEGEIGGEIEAQEARDAAYGDQTSSSEIVDEEEVAETNAAAQKVKKPNVVGASGSTGGSKGPGVTTNVHTDPVSAVRAPFGTDPIVLDSEEGEVDAAAFDATLTGLQKKVKEKAANLAAYVAQGKKLSVYTEIALRVVIEAHDKGVTVGSKDFKAAYLAKGLGEGTANAQAGQMMTLLPAFKIVSRVGNVLTPNKNSTILDAAR